MKRLGAIALAALLYAAAAPPWSIDVLAPFALAPVLLVLRGDRPRVAFATGFALALLLGPALSSWMPAMLVRFFGVSWPLAVLATGTVYVVFGGVPFGLFGIGAARLLAAPRLAAYLGIPALWVAFEFARTHAFTGLPWEFLGHTLYRRLTVIQIADTTGVCGLSFLCVLTAVAVADLLQPHGSRRGAFAAAALVAAVWTGVGGYGRWRLAEWGGAPVDPMPVALVQANRAPAHETSPVTAAMTMNAYLRLTRAGLTPERTELIVWPENTAGFYLADDAMSVAPLTRLSRETGATLVVGGPRSEGENGPIHNAAYVVGEDGVAGTYDKVHLVPFAEYAPLGLRTLSGPAAVLAPGAEPHPLPHPRGPLGVLICFEVLYPDIARDLVAQGARLLVNIANDAWTDPAGVAATRQIFSMAVFRAVETRRFLVRAATTGISGVVRPTGELGPTVGAGVAAVIRADVGLAGTLSPYVRLGDAFAWACVLAALWLLAASRPAEAAA